MILVQQAHLSPPTDTVASMLPKNSSNMFGSLEEIDMDLPSLLAGLHFCIEIYGRYGWVWETHGFVGLSSFFILKWPFGGIHHVQTTPNVFEECSGSLVVSFHSRSWQSARWPSTFMHLSWTHFRVGRVCHGLLWCARKSHLPILVSFHKNQLCPLRSSVFFGNVEWWST